MTLVTQTLAPRPIYTCACICGNTCTFQSKQGPVSHHAQRYVHEGLGYVCAHCGEVNMSKQMLDSHMPSNHGGAKFTCGVCQSAYTHPSTLSAHIQKDHKDPDNQVPCLANGYGEGLVTPICQTRLTLNSTLLNLRQLLLEEWIRIPQRYDQTLINSMRRRCTACRDARGGSTKY